MGLRDLSSPTAEQARTESGSRWTPRRRDQRHHHRFLLLAATAAALLAAGCATAEDDVAETSATAPAAPADSATSAESNDGDSAETTAADTGTSDDGDASAGVDLPITVANNGGSLEGHTPRGFAGSGTGLFTGDNLNPNFPPDDGVQIWLTFELPALAQRPTTALLESSALSSSGTPFDDLGSLSAAPVSYDAFSPELFDLEPDAEAVTCERVGETGLTCDVSTALQAAFDTGQSKAQFRLRFDEIADGDGTQDLALFFLTDSNTNEPGIFTLTLTAQ